MPGALSTISAYCHANRKGSTGESPTVGDDVARAQWHQMEHVAELERLRLALRLQCKGRAHSELFRPADHHRVYEKPTDRSSSP